MGVEIGDLSVRRCIHISAPPERVWQEFETFERMTAWFGTGHTLLQYEPELGGAVLLQIEPGGEAMQYGGKIVVFEPGREVTWDNDWIPNQGWKHPTKMTIRLKPLLDGTLVEFFHHGFESVGDDAGKQHSGYEGGWSLRQLEALRELVTA